MSKNRKTTLPIKSRAQRERPTIGVLMRGILNPVDQSRWAGVLDVAREQDVNLICFAGGILRSPYMFEAQGNVLFDLVNAGHVDGLVIWSGTLEWFIGKEIEAFCRRYYPLPVISLDRGFKGIPAVFRDDSQGVREAVAHLIEVHGYRRIACIRALEGQLEAEARYRGYTETLAEHGLPFDPNLVSPPCKNWGPEEGVAMTNLLLEERGLRPKVDFEAVVAANDEIAFGVMNVLQARGVRIPDDVAVIGFDDRAEAKGTTPPLTTVKVSFYKQGRQAAESLLARLRGERVPEQISMPTELVLRESCGCVESAVVRAAADHAGHATTTETLEAALAARRPDILSEMAKAVEVSSPGIVPGWEAQLLDAFAVDLGGDLPHAFLSALDGILHRVIESGGEADTWQGVVSVLHRAILPYLSEGKALSLAENLWHQARVLISERTAQSLARQALQAGHQALALRKVSQTLITTFDVERMMDVLTESLPTLHIPSLYLALYESPEPYEYPQPAPEWSRLILVYKDGQRIGLAPDGQRFPTRRLLPEGLLPGDRRYDLVVEPLYFREHQLGFAVLEVGPRDGTVYEAIRAQLGSALQGAQLVHQVEHRALQLQTAAAELEAANTELQRFAYVVSHDLKAPLRGISRLVEWLVGDYATAFDAKGQEMTDLLVGRVKRMDALIDGILEYSRIGRIVGQPEAIDLNRLLPEVIDLLSPPPAIQIEVAPELPVIVGDSIRIQQVFANLIGNAMKFMDKPRGLIRIDCKDAGGYWQFCVTDNGPGIEPQHYERIFQIFQTLTSRDDMESTGIGLTIVKKIVEMYGGKIWVESEPGKGSSFMFAFPKTERVYECGGENAFPNHG